MRAVESNGTCGMATNEWANITLAGNLIRNSDATGVFIQGSTRGCSGNAFFKRKRRLGDRERTDFTQTG